MRTQCIARGIVKLLGTLVVLAAVGMPCRADLVISAPNFGALSGSSGTFDILLSDNGGSFNLSGFSLELSVSPPPGVSFTAVDTTTATPYIFGALQVPPFSFDIFPNTQFTASDSDFTAPFFVTVNPGDVYGLAHVSYSVDPGAAEGPRSLAFQDLGGGTSLSDDIGNPIAFDVANGSANVVPEPASVTLVGIGAASVLLLRRRRARVVPAL
jgi:hypothetical protein